MDDEQIDELEYLRLWQGGMMTLIRRALENEPSIFERLLQGDLTTLDMSIVFSNVLDERDDLRRRVDEATTRLRRLSRESATLAILEGKR